jgi:hypothetical protein
MTRYYAYIDRACHVPSRLPGGGSIQMKPEKLHPDWRNKQERNLRLPRPVSFPPFCLFPRSAPVYPPPCLQISLPYCTYTLQLSLFTSWYWLDSSSSRAMSSPSPQRPSPSPVSAAGSSKNKRTASGHKHSKSWTARLYRKHDAKYHHSNESAPLLADEAQSEPEPSIAEVEESHEHQERHRLRDFAGHVVIDTKSMIGDIWCWFKGGANAAASGTKAAATAVGNGVVASANAVRNNPKKTMGTVIALLSTALTGVSTTYAIDRVGHKTRWELCTTPMCVKASNYILRNLHPTIVVQPEVASLDLNDTDIDPCTDFDQYVCGNFHHRFDLREDQSELNTGMLLAPSFHYLLTKTRHNCI